jgi:hypothetical protein
MRGSATVRNADFEKEVNKMKLDMQMVENQLQSVKKIVTEDDQVARKMRESPLLLDSGAGTELNFN